MSLSINLHPPPEPRNQLTYHHVLPNRPARLLPQNRLDNASSSVSSHASVAPPTAAFPTTRSTLACAMQIVRRRLIQNSGVRFTQGSGGTDWLWLWDGCRDRNALVDPSEPAYYCNEGREGGRWSLNPVSARPRDGGAARMNFFFPVHHALYLAGCATHSLHNVITSKGALVRDAKAWAQYLDESLVLFRDQLDVLCAGHNWPTWAGRRSKNSSRDSVICMAISMNRLSA